MSSIKNISKIHNFNLIGIKQFESGLNSNSIEQKNNKLIETSNLQPPKFKLRETIQEIGLGIKLEYKNYKFNIESETIVVFEPFHFQDFDNEELNLWSYFELSFHQLFLYSVTFNSNKIEIYEQLLKYLANIYGPYIEIPDQDNSNRRVAWFFKNGTNSIYLEIEQKGNGERFLVLTYYDILLHMSLNKPYSIYSQIRNEVYKKDRELFHEKSKQGFFTKFIKRFNSPTNKGVPDFPEIKSYVENNLLNDLSKLEFKKVANYIVAKIFPQQLNLEIGDWLINIAIKIQEKELLNEAEDIYNLFLNWYSDPEFIPSNERIELVANAYKNLINVYGDSNKNKDAINSFLLCISTLDTNRSYVNNYTYAYIAGLANYNVARVYHNLGEQDKAIEHSKNALDYYEPFVSPWVNKIEITTIILAINNLGNYFSSKGQYDEAINNFVMGIRFAIDNNRYYDSSVINMNLAITLVKLKKYEKAEKLYNTLLDLISKDPEIYQYSDLRGQVLLNFADMCKESQNGAMEKKYLSEAIAFYENALKKHPEMEELVGNLKKRMRKTR